MSTEEHLADIDFRKKEVRRTQYKQDFIGWYEDLHRRLATDYSEFLDGQLQMLTSVLWYLLDDKEYKKLTRRKR